MHNTVLPNRCPRVAERRLSRKSAVGFARRSATPTAFIASRELKRPRAGANPAANLVPAWLSRSWSEGSIAMKAATPPLQSQL